MNNSNGVAVKKGSIAANSKSSKTSIPDLSLRTRAARRVESAWGRMPRPVRKGMDCARRLYGKLRHSLEYLGLISPSTKVVPIESLVQERHLELEPLCCLSSCLVRGGCMAVFSFQIFYAAVLVLYAFVRMWKNGHFDVWRPLVFQVQEIISHHLFLYLLVFIASITTLMSLILLRGLMCFDKKLLFLHVKFDYFLFAFNFVAALLFALALSSEGIAAWNFFNIVLFLNFFSQLPIQLWAMSVVRSCADFFSLIQVFLTLAEK